MMRSPDPGPELPRDEPADPRLTVLLITASVGGGHDGPAREIARRLDHDGHLPVVVDLIDLAPWRSGPLLRRLFQWQLALAPRLWGLLYDRLDDRGTRPWFAEAVIAAAGRRLAAMATGHRVDLLVSTFPLGGLVVAASRPRGVTAPLVTYVTDPAAHAIWAHPTTSRYLVTAASTAADLWRSGPARVSVVWPAVGPEFRPLSASLEKAALRTALGLPAGRLALVTSGSWGVGDVARSAREVRQCGVTPVVVCGRNARLRRVLEREDGIIVWGWTNRMADLMRACDAVVLNSGGLTLMEAVASRTPVLHYRPLPGQGQANAAACERNGLALWPRRASDLADALDTVVRQGTTTGLPHGTSSLMGALLGEIDRDGGFFPTAHAGTG